MCDIKHDEIERLVALRGDLRKRQRDADKQRDRFGAMSYVSGETHGQADAYAVAAMLVENRIVEALGFDANRSVPQKGTE